MYLITGTATEYVSLIAGTSVFITSDSPKDYILAGVFGFVYFGGKLLEKASRDKELKNLEEKLKK